MAVTGTEDVGVGGQAPQIPRRIEPALLLGTVLLVLALAAVLTVRPWRRPQVAWRSDIAGALLAAKHSGNLVFVEVYADWCDPCRQMERDTFSDAAVGRALASLHPVRLNDDRMEVQREMVGWRAWALPAHLLLNSDGTVHAQSLGYMPPADFLAWIKRGTSRR
ncbi:MAG: thioredoxin family protein [Fimbriimonadaceae bacterium]